MLAAGFYEVSQQPDGSWLIEYFQGSNVVGGQPAVSEKQAHFLAKQAYPGIKSPAERERDFNADYYSKDGFAYRKQHEAVGA